MYVALAQALGVSVEQLEAAWRTKIGSRELANARDMDNWGNPLDFIKSLSQNRPRALVEGLVTQDKANKLLAGELNGIDLLSECLRSSGDYKERLHAAAAETLKISVFGFGGRVQPGPDPTAACRGTRRRHRRRPLRDESVHQEQIRQAVKQR